MFKRFLQENNKLVSSLIMAALIIIVFLIGMSYIRKNIGLGIGNTQAAQEEKSNKNKEDPLDKYKKSEQNIQNEERSKHPEDSQQKEKTEEKTNSEVSSDTLTVATPEIKNGIIYLGEASLKGRDGYSYEGYVQDKTQIVMGYENIDSSILSSTDTTLLAYMKSDKTINSEKDAKELFGDTSEFNMLSGTESNESPIVQDGNCYLMQSQIDNMQMCFVAVKGSNGVYLFIDKDVQYWINQIK